MHLMLCPTNYFLSRNASIRILAGNQDIHSRVDLEVPENCLAVHPLFLVSDPGSPIMRWWGDGQQPRKHEPMGSCMRHLWDTLGM